MKKFSYVWIALSLMIATSAFCQDVRYNFDKNSDFSKFKTYKWVAIKGAQQPDELTDKQLKDTIDAELAKKGLSRVETDNADLFVGYQTAIGSEKQLTSFSTGGAGWGYGGGWYGGGYGGMGTTTSTTSTIYTGQLVLDMYNTTDKDLVWRGTVSKTLDPKAKPEKRQKNMTKAIGKLLKNYPPQVK